MGRAAYRTFQRLPLIWRVFTIHVGVAVVAGAFLAVYPSLVGRRPLGGIEALVLVSGLALILALDLYVLRRALRPIHELTGLMRGVDPLRPGQRVEVDHREQEVAALAEAFNGMLDRLETERRESGRGALAAQERERRRIARELHDEIGQTLTAVMLRVKNLERFAPPEVQSELKDVGEEARAGVDDVRAIVRRLRPEALDELGLVNALQSLTSRFSQETGLPVETRVEPGLPTLSPDVELVIYRVAQESLTNAARHAQASRVNLELGHGGRGVVLRVRDDGTGINGVEEAATSGIRGMRERAVLIGGTLQVASVDSRGTEVRLEAPTQ